MSAPLPEGALFSGRYRVVRLIAQGGMGAVYEVVHTETNRRRALKIMHPHIFESDELRERFKREARIAADIESEHIVDVSDAGIDEATLTPFMVMELLRGEELGKRVKRLGPLPVADVLTYLRQTAIALDKTHAASIVHRDLKPDNLFLTHRDDHSPRIKILDFGVAKVVADGATGQGTQSLGTPLYMAPEQFHPGAKLSPAADIFALGLVAFTLLVGFPYWRPESTTAGGLIPFITLAIHGPQVAPVERAATMGVTLPRAFDEWFFRATAFKPENRFGSASVAIEALKKVFAGLSEVDLVTTIPMVRPPAPSVPALGQTPGTFVPTAAPEVLPPAKEVPTAARARPTLWFVGAGTTSVVLIALVAWMALRTETSVPAEPAVLAPTVSQTMAPPVRRDPPTVEPTTAEVVPVASSSAMARPVESKPKPDKPAVKPPATSPTPPAPAPLPAKPPKPDLIGQD